MVVAVPEAALDCRSLFHWNDGGDNEEEQEGEEEEEEEEEDVPYVHRFDPYQVIEPEQLAVYNLLTHPVWIFDFIHRKNRYANKAALEVWDSPSLDEFTQRDMSKMSDVTAARTLELQKTVERGEMMQLQWTFYPKGIPKTFHVSVLGLRLSHEESHVCMLVHGIPPVKETLPEESIRGVEILRHLPMAICQFDLDGKIMFQNQAAHLPNNEGEHHTNTINTVEEPHHPGNSSDKQTSNSSQHLSEQLLSSDSQNSNHRTSTSSHSATVIEEADKNVDFIKRFVNAKVGKESLTAIQSNEEVTLHAELRTNHGPQWSAIQLRKTSDPVTNDKVILYSAQDKSDALIAKKEREASVQKSEFLAIMAHEIRTPLHQVMGCIDLLDKTTSLDIEQKSYINLLKSSAQGLMTVISDVLDYSKLEAGQMKVESIPYEPLIVLHGAMEAVRSGCEEKGLSLTKEWSKEIPFQLLGDPNRLRQVLLNFLSNAVKFTHTGGVLVQAFPTCQASTTNFHNSTISDDDDEDDDEKTLNKHNNSNQQQEQQQQKGFKPCIKFVITDTGAGICKEHQHLIFQKGQQVNISVARHYGGTGLGLSISQQLVEKMGGTIGVESELGCGSSFWFTLPMTIPEEKVVRTDDSIGEGLPAEMELCRELNILVAEDNRINQKLVCSMLQRMGHHFAIADNGEMAIDMIQKESYDVVLMDIQMPVMDGLEATRRLRSLGYVDLPILGLTASVKHSDFQELGFSDWLGKPIPMNELKVKLQKLGRSKI